MAAPDKEQPLILSVLDRLMDPNPELERDPRVTRGQSLTDLRNAVRRDLENLLNTRHRCIGWPSDLTELETSLVNYGVPDLASTNVATAVQRQEFVAKLERTIRRFEPRFQTLRIVPLENADPLDRTMRFRIEALIYADPMPEAMVFDSMVDPTSRSFAVTSKSNG